MPEAETLKPTPAHEPKPTDAPSTRKISEEMPAVAPPVTDIDLLIEDELGAGAPLEKPGETALAPEDFGEPLSPVNPDHPFAGEIIRLQNELRLFYRQLADLGFKSSDKQIKLLATMPDENLRGYPPEKQQAALKLRAINRLSSEISQLKDQMAN